MMKYVLITLLWGLATGGYADVFTWTDSSGVVHFSDVPHEGASKIKVPDAQTFQSNPAKPEESAEEQANPALFEYESFKIVQPKNEETIRNTEGFVGVMMQVVPNLRDGDRIQMIFDGQPVGEPQASLMFNLNGINRGAHTVSAKIIDKEGNTMIECDPVTVFMMQPRVNMVKPAAR